MPTFSPRISHGSTDFYSRSAHYPAALRWITCENQAASGTEYKRQGMSIPCFVREHRTPDMDRHRSHTYDAAVLALDLRRLVQSLLYAVTAHDSFVFIDAGMVLMFSRVIAQRGLTVTADLSRRLAGPERDGEQALV